MQDKEPLVTGPSSTGPYRSIWGSLGGALILREGHLPWKVLRKGPVGSANMSGYQSNIREPSLGILFVIAYANK